MPDLPTDWSALCALVFLLGMRHGFDADHLAAIDGLTRLSAGSSRAFSRHCGALFSLGHGCVVILVALSVGLISERWEPPGWLSAFGAWLSVAFLLLIGVANLRAVLRAPPGRVVALTGLKAPFLARFFEARSPLAVATVGALFALSFDTLSQAALFAMTASQHGGVPHALMLGLLFVGGMLLTDALNGWWIAHLIARADQIAAIASRVMGLAVSGVSLLVAAFGIGKLLTPQLARWSEHSDLAFGAVVVLVMGLSYLLACAGASNRRVPA